MICYYLVSLTLLFSTQLPEGGHLKVKQFGFKTYKEASKFTRYYLLQLDKQKESPSIIGVDIVKDAEPFKCEDFN